MHLFPDDAWLAAQVAKYEDLAYSVNTQRTYKSQRKSYLTFCETYNLSAVPASTDTIVKYAAYLASKLKYNSIKCYMNAIRLLHLEFGIPNPLLSNFRYTQVMRGIRRALGDTPAQKAPMTIPLLKNIRSSLNLDSN